MVEKLFSLLFGKKNKRNCIDVRRNECSYIKKNLIERKNKNDSIDLMYRGKFYNTIFMANNQR